MSDEPDEPDIWRISVLDKSLAARAAILEAICLAAGAVAATPMVDKLKAIASDPARPASLAHSPELQQAWREMMFAMDRATDILKAACPKPYDDDDEE